MAFVKMNPRYRPFLEQQGLVCPEQFLALPAVIVSGHPDRHVAQVTLGAGPAAIAAYLKREHRVPWRDRLASAWAGFGFASKSYREAQTLEALRQAGIGCPDWIAVGEDGQGRAFVLIEELTGTIDLRRFLRDRLSRDLRERRRFARTLGEALARIHNAGFDHPDLYSKHILVNPCDLSIHFLDWQRSRRREHVAWKHRCRDLAALDATLAEGLATPRERLACLRAYVRIADGSLQSAICNLQSAIRDLRQRVRRLLRKRHVREVRNCKLPVGRQAVLWLDGEALCVTPDFWAELQGDVPDWLRLANGPAGWGERMTRTVVALPGGRQGQLVCRWRDQPLRWLWTKLRCRPLRSPELRQAGMLFRQQRQGVEAPRLLAFGQRCPLPWRTESFLLTEIAGPDEEKAK